MGAKEPQLLLSEIDQRFEEEVGTPNRMFT